MLLLLLAGAGAVQGNSIRRRVSLVGRRVEPTLLGRHEEPEDLIGRRLTPSVQGRVEDE
jgi:hypothetical protein